MMFFTSFSQLLLIIQIVSFSINFLHAGTGYPIAPGTGIKTDVPMTAGASASFKAGSGSSLTHNSPNNAVHFGSSLNFPNAKLVSKGSGKLNAVPSGGENVGPAEQKLARRKELIAEIEKRVLLRRPDIAENKASIYIAAELLLGMDMSTDALEEHFLEAATNYAESRYECQRILAIKKIVDGMTDDMDPEECAAVSPVNKQKLLKVLKIDETAIDPVQDGENTQQELIKIMHQIDYTLDLLLQGDATEFKNDRASAITEALAILKRCNFFKGSE